ncbi:hypothetical protein [Rhodococcus opacus]|uniref:hypothetical protein n=1 Tax=Rhodococcus opacus TaxID=37919 RepID=UPI003D148246
MTNAAKKLQGAVPGDGHGASSVLQDSIQTLLGTVAEKALSSVSDKVSNTSGRMTGAEAVSAIVVYRLVSFLLMATIGWIVFAARFRGTQQQGEEGPDPAPLWRPGT